MNTKNSITPWHHSHLTTIRIHDFVQSKKLQGSSKQRQTIIQRKKSHSLQIVDARPLRKKLRQLDRIQTIDSSLAYERQRSQQQINEKNELLKRVKFLRERKVWEKKKLSLQTIISDSKIFKSKYQLNSEKSCLKLPKIEIKVIK